MTIRTGLLFSLLFLLISGFQCFAKEIQTSTDLLNEIAQASKKTGCFGKFLCFMVFPLPSRDRGPY